MSLHTQYLIFARSLVPQAMLYILQFHFSHFDYTQKPICTLRVYHLQVFGLLVQILLALQENLILPRLRLFILANLIYVYIPQWTLVQDPRFHDIKLYFICKYIVDNNFITVPLFSSTDIIY